MSRQEGDGLIDVAVRDRNAGIGQSADAGRNAGDHANVDAGLDKRLRLFTAASEHKGITALEPQNPLVLAGELDQPKRDVPLAW